MKILEEVKALGYRDPKILSDGKIGCLMQFLFTYAIVTIIPSDIDIGYEDRWCYHSYDKAKKALEDWNGEGEPCGWHRHPPSGRRRDDGDPITEHINH